MRMRLYEARRERANARMDCASSGLGAKPARRMRMALGTARRIGSGDGMTAASATASCSISTLSSSNGLMR